MMKRITKEHPKQKKVTFPLNKRWSRTWNSCHSVLPLYVLHPFVSWWNIGRTKDETSQKRNSQHWRNYIFTEGNELQYLTLYSPVSCFFLYLHIIQKNANDERKEKGTTRSEETTYRLKKRSPSTWPRIVVFCFLFLSYLHKINKNERKEKGTTRTEEIAYWVKKRSSSTWPWTLLLFPASFCTLKKYRNGWRWSEAKRNN